MRGWRPPGADAPTPGGPPMTDFEYRSPSPYNPGHLHVQNRKARGLIEFPLDVARTYGGAAANAGEVARVAAWYAAEFFDGMIIDLAALFPDAPARRFWCRAFFDVATRV